MFALLKLSDIAKYFICRRFLKKERWVKNLTTASRAKENSAQGKS
jgi:hypothetical protein